MSAAKAASCQIFRQLQYQLRGCQILMAAAPALYNIYNTPFYYTIIFFQLQVLNFQNFGRN
jgi:hypothetical protein